MAMTLPMTINRSDFSKWVAKEPKAWVREGRSETLAEPSSTAKQSTLSIFD
jgi:hypothetical protein